MGASGSRLDIPGITISETNAYAKGRKKAAKDLLAAQKAFISANAAYAGSLKSAGAALLIFCEGTSAFSGSVLAESFSNPPPPASQHIPSPLQQLPSSADSYKALPFPSPTPPPPHPSHPSPHPYYYPPPQQALLPSHQQQLSSPQIIESTQNKHPTGSETGGREGGPSFAYRKGSDHVPVEDERVNTDHQLSQHHPPPPPPQRFLGQTPKSQSGRLQASNPYPVVSPSDTNAPPSDDSLYGSHTTFSSPMVAENPARNSVSYPPPSLSPDPASLPHPKSVHASAPPLPQPPPPSPPPHLPPHSHPPNPYPPHSSPYPPVSPTVHPYYQSAPRESSFRHPDQPPLQNPSPDVTHPEAAYEVVYPPSGNLSGYPHPHLLPAPEYPPEKSSSAHGEYSTSTARVTDNLNLQVHAYHQQPSGQNPNAGNGGAISFVPYSQRGGVVWGDTKLAELARGLNDLFLEAMEKLAPLNEVLAIGPPLDKIATPSLHPSAARKNDGRMEAVGESIQKLVNWERYLKNEIKMMENIKAELKRSDKKLAKQSKKANKERAAGGGGSHGSKSEKKVQGAKLKVEDANVRLNAAVQSVATISSAIEAFKTELLLPQILRILPELVGMWARLTEVHDKQRQLAAEIERSEGPHIARSARFTALALRGGGSAAGAFGGTPGSESGLPGTTKAQHEASKKLEEEFKKWHSALSSMSQAQRKLASVITVWVRKSLNIPPGFPNLYSLPPNPYPPHPSSLRPPLYAPHGAAASSGEGPVISLCNDWMRTLDNLPENEFKDAVNAFAGWVREAHELQGQEIKQAKKTEDLRKALGKADGKLEALMQREREVQLSLGGVTVGGGGKDQEKETRSREAKAKSLAAEVAAAKAHSDELRNKLSVENVTLARLGEDGQVAIVSAVQKGLPAIFQNVTKFSTVCARAYGILQHQHAPWLSHGAY